VAVIDMHTHFFPRKWPDFAARFGTPDWPWLEPIDANSAMVMVGDRQFRRISHNCWDATARLEEMDRDGVDVQVISATPVLFNYAKPAMQALECAQFFNDAALEICSHSPKRLKALCQVPLQDVDLACRELSSAMAGGHLGVQIGNHVGKDELSSKNILTFLEHCAAENAVVLIHPWDLLGADRMGRYMLPWLVAMPAETQLSILSLILSGAFERLPPSLKICFAHGGGSFAYLLGRIDNAWTYSETVRADCPNPPSSYVDRFYVDSAVFSPVALSLLVKVMGEDRVMLGSDYPFPLGEARVGNLIRTHEGFAPDVREKLLSRNAASFFGIDVQEASSSIAA
jgi:aminocarboxymuconate-semialdehyde decarboxylase